MKKRLLIAGGTGLIGSAIHQEADSRGWDVTILSRQSIPGGIKWNPARQEINLQVPLSFDAIINLAGVSIAGSRWTAEHIRDVHDSRVNACQTIEKFIQNGLLSTEVYIGCSAIGIYGDHGNQLVDENSHLGKEDDWMVTTGKAWEEGHAKMSKYGVRVVVLRTGIVLSTQGGALKEMLKTASAGIIGYFGNGKQYWPWIHIMDMVNLVSSIIDDIQMNGLYLAAAPDPVTNKELSTTLASIMQPKRLVVPVPEFFLAILLGEMRRMLLQSCKGYPARLLTEGFSFRFPKLKNALEDLMLQRKNSTKH